MRYMLLEAGEPTLEGDEIYSTTFKKWILSPASIVPKEVFMRRKIISQKIVPERYDVFIMNDGSLKMYLSCSGWNTFVASDYNTHSNSDVYMNLGLL